MDSNAQILEVLLKINKSLDEIKDKMGVSPVTTVAEQKKIETATKDVAKVAAKVIKEEKPVETAKPAEAPAPTNNEDFYSAFIEKYVKPTIAASNELGGKYTVLGEIIDTLYGKLQQEIFIKAASCKAPTQQEMVTLFAPVVECNKKLDELNKDRDFPPNYVKTMTEIIACIYWINVPEDPADMVTQTLDSATFWMNKIRRTARDQMDPKPQHWCANLIAMMKELIQIITDRYPEGFKWNDQGVAFSDYKPAEAKPAEAKPTEKKDFKSELLNAVSSRRAEDGSLGLRHVEKSEMTSKNPALRGHAKLVKKEEKVTLTKPPRCELVLNKWWIENQTENVEVTAKLNQTIYAINCVGSTITVKGKCNSIIMDSCKKSNIIFDKCVSTAEVVNSKQCKVQCLTNVPTVSVDKTDGCTIYFPRSCLETIRIVTSKCSDTNVSFPSKDDEQDWVERAIPEQYVHTIVDEAVKTDVSELYSC